MPSGNDKLPDIQASFRKLSSAASSLNQASDELGKISAIFDAALKKLNIGIAVFVTVRIEEDERGHYDRYELAYCKVKGSWGLAICRVVGDQLTDEEETKDVWLFNEAPRRIRLQAIDRMPKLFDDLANAASRVQKDLEVSINKGRTLLQALNLPEIEEEFPQPEVQK